MKQETNLEKQLRLFKEYDINGDYHIIDDKIIFKSNLTVNQKIVDKDFLRDVTILCNLEINLLDECDVDLFRYTTICNNLILPDIRSCHKDFLKYTEVGFSIELKSLKVLPKGFLKYKIIPGNLYLDSIIKCDKYSLKDTYVGCSIGLPKVNEVNIETFKDTYIGKFLLFDSLDEKLEELMKNNIKKLEFGYNKKRKYWYFDILLHVLGVKKYKEYTIYETCTGYMVQRGNLVAHSKKMVAFQDGNQIKWY